MPAQALFLISFLAFLFLLIIIFAVIFIFKGTKVIFNIGKYFKKARHIENYVKKFGLSPDAIVTKIVIKEIKQKELFDENGKFIGFYAKSENSYLFGKKIAR